MIAHRLTTVQGCDRVITLRGGRVETPGLHESPNREPSVAPSPY
jgi:ABC-type transport system involved in Fe-S cluster assembly fused permease/ATPase subunit